MSTYNVTAAVLTAPARGHLLKIGFNPQKPGQNDELVRDASVVLKSLELPGGELVLLNGPASLPVACVIAHGVAHIYGAIAVFDPKMAGYVVSISHDPARPIGTVIAAADVKTEA